MIITQKKPIEEVIAMVGDAKRIGIVGCSSCATACATGGQKEIAELTKVLEGLGKTVVVSAVAEYCCMNLGVRGTLKPFQDKELDCVIGMSCGDGVQVVANNINVPVYPSNNTMFLGETKKLGLF